MLRVASYNEETFNRIEMMRDITWVDKSICMLVEPGGGGASRNYYADLFKRGLGLFWVSVTGQVASELLLQDMVPEWGVLPMPMLDEAQGQYFGGVNQNASVLGVTVNNQDIYEVSVLLDAFGRNSEKLKDVLWPDMNVTYWRSDEDAEMVEKYITGTGQYDPAVMLWSANANIRSLIEATFNAVLRGGRNFSGEMEMNIGKIENAICEMFGYDLAEYGLTGS
jgi:hypothetical protein